MALPTPRTFGPYVLGPKIGAGGMASVFAARHQSAAGASRVVALKVMSTSLAHERSARDRFLREARLAIRLEHSNVVRVYDSGEIDGELFLAMELVEGASLARMLQFGRVPLPIALRVAIDLARGLHAAHELCDEGGEPLLVVHQDVTPHNVLIGYDGTTKLLDFGVARVLRHDRSRSDSVTGKPGYLAPEQLLLGKLDRRVDVFALGVVLHEMLTGRPLFAGESIAAIHEQVLSLEIPRVDVSCRDLPTALADVVERALRRATDERFPSADALRAALRELGRFTAIAEQDEVAAWVSTTVPPQWSRRSLERELSGVQPDVADLETLHPIAKPARADARRARLAAVGIAAVLVVALVGVFGFVRSSSVKAPPPSPEVTAVSAPVASAIPALPVATAVVSEASAIASSAPSAPRAIATVAKKPTLAPAPPTSVSSAAPVAQPPLLSNDR